jgi:hypothetical protein
MAPAAAHSRRRTGLVKKTGRRPYGEQNAQPGVGILELGFWTAVPKVRGARDFWSFGIWASAAESANYCGVRVWRFVTLVERDFSFQKSNFSTRPFANSSGIHAFSANRAREYWNHGGTNENKTRRGSPIIGHRQLGSGLLERQVAGALGPFAFNVRTMWLSS